MLSSVNSCAICSTHKRPADVPWHQHTVGCPIRSGSLSAGVSQRDQRPVSYRVELDGENHRRAA